MLALIISSILLLHPSHHVKALNSLICADVPFTYPHSAQEIIDYVFQICRNSVVVVEYGCCREKWRKPEIKQSSCMCGENLLYVWSRHYQLNLRKMMMRENILILSYLTIRTPV